MASLNLSTNGPSISKSYQSVVNAPAPSGPAGSSPTYGQWAVFSVSAPLVSAFQQDSAGKESVLKVQSSGEGELIDLVDEFSEGKVQFAYVKVKDPNTGLPKNVLIGWCGEGVPERTKGYFTSHLAAVSKLLHGYHVQIAARSDRDLTPEGIIQKVADSSGAKYSAGDAPSAPTAPAAPAPAVATKPVFTPSRTVGSFKPLSSSRQTGSAKDEKVDEDGWGDDAPPVTRTQLEKVQPAYKPTKVNMDDFRGQKSATTTSSSERRDPPSSGDVVKGDYQPIGKVDIGAIKRQARETGATSNDRPEPVKGSYEPVGKVDIAAIRAKAQGGQEGAQSPPTRVSPAATGGSGDQEDDRPRPLAERSAAFKPTERLTTMPKPKVSNKFGGASTFTGTKAPLPGGFEAQPNQTTGASGGASRTFADEGGKTPAQVWAEKKAKERGGAPAAAATESRPLQSQESGQGGWRSSYTGKTWAPVQTTHTGASAPDAGAQEQDDRPESPQEEEPQTGNMGAIREKFAQSAPMGAPAPAGYERAAPPPPPVENNTKPVDSEEPPASSLPIRSQPAEEPAPPMPQRRSPSPEQRSPVETGSPIRVAMPVGRGSAEEEEPSAPVAGDRYEQETIPHQEPAGVPSGDQGIQASVLYDYERDADDELELREGELVTGIQMVDEDWWMGVNQQGEQGLFPSNYVKLHEDSNAPEESATLGSATAQFDYEAAEDNELTFPEGAKITDIEAVDENWWYGVYNGRDGLFPANYVERD